MTLIYPHAYFAYGILILGYVEIDCYINDKTTKTDCSFSYMFLTVPITQQLSELYNYTDSIYCTSTNIP